MSDYRAYLATPDGKARCELLWSNLEPHLGRLRRRRRGAQALDAGSGPGELASRLADRGFKVVLLDASPEMLEGARRKLAGRAAEFVLGDVADADTVLGQRRFAFVACHFVLEYAKEPRVALASLVRTLARGGVMSLATRSAIGGTLKYASQGELERAFDAVNTTRFVDAWGTRGVLLEPRRIRRWLRTQGLRIVDEAGVRVFPIAAPSNPQAFDRLLELERAVSRRSHYRAVARYAQYLAIKE